ncbi:class D beta-lactamase [uncultured Succinatimonas sp.]|uniref:class D beta-lactamase n=1 Tax=uncultured Succinatimonas sp. TaxID=1262973 RepID=UPI0025DA655E|nr:class D beta-lactamase [uncultured Succinatimonas sp.]
MRFLKFFTTLFVLLVSFQVFAAEVKYSKSLAEVFNDHTGVMVLKEINVNCVLGSDEKRAVMRFSPASTFKIAHSLIALDLGIVKNVDEVFFSYDGHSQYFLKSWQKDMGLKEAVKTSNVEAFKVMASKIGKERMQKALALFDYGNANIGKDITSFWLDGTLKISALEQLSFLEKLLNGQLPCSKKAQKEVENLLKLESNEKYVLYGKTGLSSGTNQIGWFVGFLCCEDKTYIFALNMDMDENTPYALRIDLAKKGLEKLGLLK